MAVSQREIAEILERFIRSRFRVPVKDPLFSQTVDLFDSGYVDSVGVVELISFLESTFKIKIPEESLFSTEFTTISGISGIVLGRAAAIASACGGASTLRQPDPRTSRCLRFIMRNATPNAKNFSSPERMNKPHPIYRDAAPPVIILNLSYSGLGIARDLAGRGVRLIGLSSDRKIYGNFSRFCEVRFAPSSQDEPERLAEFLLQSAGELNGAVIFPTSDFDVLFLDHFRVSLEPHYRLSVPPRRCLFQVMDKYALFCEAIRAGVPVPRTVVVHSHRELAQIPEAIGFPCVVKPVWSFHWRNGNFPETLKDTKALRLDSLKELETRYAEVAAASARVLVQEWIPGDADRIVVLGGYFNESSEPLSYFTARKIVQSPDDFGTGCVVESVELPEILTPTVKLLRDLGYQGMAEVEYRQDPRTGEYKLIEINTRHWDWHRLGSASGVNVSWTAYCHLTGKPVNPTRVPILQATWIAEDALFYYLLKAIFARRLNARKLWRRVKGPRIYGIFDRKDPLPFFRYWVQTVIPRVAKKLFDELRRKPGGAARRKRSRPKSSHDFRGESRRTGALVLPLAQSFIYEVVLYDLLDGVNLISPFLG
ncbi:MAG: hypothetical protein HY695_20375 [Deltaproteobacteria bacterium]|nr:hypothetical protein [Deltaproteobacteria bacterium]